MLTVQDDGPVRRLTLNRPEVRNAFNDELIAALTDSFGSVGDHVRVVVIAGEGKALSAGGDLEWMRKAAGYSLEQNTEDALRLGALFESIANCPAAVIARVHGAAFGGGCGLVAAADVAVAEENTLFAFSEGRLGLIPATISPFVVPKIGGGNARWLFTTAEAFDAATALRIGLVHEVTNVVELDAAVDRKVKAVLKCGPQAVAASKRVCVKGPFSMPESARMLAAARASEEGREGVAAFLEKRPAGFVVE